LEKNCLRDKLSIPSGERHELCRGLHAEQNAVVQAATYGVAIDGAALYCTHQPCSACTKIIINAGIKRIVYKDPYPDELAEELLKESSIEFLCLK
jgi:dCMP deaminase